jgi:methylmalonyl-CoA/ethylmalonyl-CoA epimerase
MINIVSQANELERETEGPMTSAEVVAERGVPLREIGQVAITVDDLSRARDFYRDVLGMPMLFDAGAMAFFQCGSVRLMLGLAEKPEPRGGTILYFRVGDLTQTHAELEAKGVVFVQPPHLVARMPDYELWMAFLKDPEGNVLGLMQEVRPGGQEEKR